MGSLLVVLWGYFLRNWLKSGSGKLTLDRFLRSLPGVGVLVRDTSLVRIFLFLQITSTVGLDLLKSLKISAQASGSSVIEQDFKGLVVTITEGSSIHGYLDRSSELYPKDVVGIISVGEEAGGMSDCFKYLGRYYEQEVEYRVDSLLAMLEPLLTALVSLFVGAVVLSLLLPLYSVLQKL